MTYLATWWYWVIALVVGAAYWGYYTGKYPKGENVPNTIVALIKGVLWPLFIAWEVLAVFIAIGRIAGEFVRTGHVS